MAETKVERPKLPLKPLPEPKKKKKNAPDRPQPAWLFPPDEQNPVLNAKPKTEEQLKKEKAEKETSLDYMRRRVHGVPSRPAPPAQLLTLVGIFLTDFGFNSTSRLFTNERKARQELNGWEDALGKKIEKGTPTLEHIYREWYREFKIKQKDETSSSESGSEHESDSEEEGGIEFMTKQAISDEDGGASSDDFEESDVEMKDAPKVKKSKAVKKSKKHTDSSSSSSDSDADDEDEKSVKPKGPKVSKKVESKQPAAPEKPTVDAMISNLKRKASNALPENGVKTANADGPAKAKKAKTTASTSGTAPESSLRNGTDRKTGFAALQNTTESSESPSSESENDQPKINGTGAKTATAESDDSSDDLSDDDEESASMPIMNGTTTTMHQARSDSAINRNDITKPIGSDTSESSESESSDEAPAISEKQKKDKKAKAPEKVEASPGLKKKHQGAKPTPLAEASANATENDHISNKYQSYEYADRAYKDLSVTRGKGFTKEKNKKKRGSYRGGAIDTSGGKGFKFED